MSNFPRFAQTLQTNFKRTFVNEVTYVTVYRYPICVRKISFCRIFQPILEAKRDVFGPVDPKSNLRVIKTFYIPPDETSWERDYRLKRIEVQEWNQEFWTAHNLQFLKVFNSYSILASF